MGRFESMPSAENLELKEENKNLFDECTNAVKDLNKTSLLKQLGKSKFVKRIAFLMAFLSATEAIAAGKKEMTESHKSAKEAIVEVVKIVKSKPDVLGKIQLNGQMMNMFEKQINDHKMIHTNDAFSFIKEEKRNEKGDYTIYSVDAGNDGILDEVVLVPGKVDKKDEAMLEVGFSREDAESISTEVGLAEMEREHSESPLPKRQMYFHDTKSDKWFGADFATGEIKELEQNKIDKQQASWEVRINTAVAELKGPTSK